MTENKLLVSKIENGIVIDHIPREKAFSVLKILKISPESKVVIACNVDSSKLGKKDIIKLEGKYLTSKEIDLISLVAPAASINRIENWEVKEKHNVELPEEIEGVFKCKNPFCKSNLDDQATGKFKIVKGDVLEKILLECLFCGSPIYYPEAVEYLIAKASIGALVSREKIEKTLLDTLIRKGALKIAPNKEHPFIFKSGRRSPNFITLGALTDGEALAKLKWALASYVALLLEEKRIDDFDFVFGVAYKGINLAVLACEGLNELFGLKKRYLYDRKEEKGYGVPAERAIVGYEYFKPGSSVLLIDDVITTGGAKVEALEKLKLLGEHKVAGLVLVADRQEKMGDAVNVEDRSAVQYLQDRFGVKVFSILSMQTIYNLVKSSLSEEIKQSWIDYYEKYGVVKFN